MTSDLDVRHTFQKLEPFPKGRQVQRFVLYQNYMMFPLVL